MTDRLYHLFVTKEREQTSLSVSEPIAYHERHHGRERAAPVGHERVTPVGHERAASVWHGGY